MMIIRLFASAQYTNQVGEKCTRSVIDAPSEHNAQKERKNLTCSPSSVIHHATASYDQPEKKDVAARAHYHSASVWISRKTHLSCDAGERVNGSHEQRRQRNFIHHALRSLSLLTHPLSAGEGMHTPRAHLPIASREYKNRRLAQSGFIPSSSNIIEYLCPH